MVPLYGSHENDVPDIDEPRKIMEWKTPGLKMTGQNQGWTGWFGVRKSI